MKTVLMNKANSGDFSLETIDERVFLENHHYKNIFGKTYSDEEYLPSKRGIVKISLNNRKIYRIFSSANSKSFNNDMIGLSIISLQQLGIGNEQEKNIKLSKGNRVCFMFNHPNHSIRIAYKISLFAIAFSLMITVLSLYISFIFPVCCR